MEVKEFEIEGPKLITLKKFDDDRGFFVERFQRQKFAEVGLPTEFVQDNFSRSKPKVLRGLHYQFNQPQGKLVTAMNGTIFDVAVDIRKGSPTYGNWIGVELSGDEPAWLWVPPGFAHGFCVIGNSPADVLYKVDAPYNHSGESGIIWDDKQFDIRWPINNPVLSPKDNEMQTFADYNEDPKF